MYIILTIFNFYFFHDLDNDRLWVVFSRNEQFDTFILPWFFGIWFGRYEKLKLYNIRLMELKKETVEFMGVAARREKDTRPFVR